MTTTARSIGIHALVWVGSWGEENARRAIEGARSTGYNRIEIPLLLWDMQVPMTRALLAENGLAMTGNLFLTAETDISSEDPAAVAAGEQRLTDGLDIVAGLGGDYLCGTMYSMLGKYDHPPTEKGWANCADVLRRVADHAAAAGITLGLELCNRYETNLLNTASQALAMIAEVDRPNVTVHLDTYHMNIEETDVVSAVLECGDRLGYVHIGESHRGYLGTGNVDFAGFFRALAHIGYRGPVTFESFSSAVETPELSAALCIWRVPWEDSRDLATKARGFIQAHLDASEEYAALTGRSR
jgi:D-psicose/D-tagatose/L-ribulose 3-epimerase